MDESLLRTLVPSVIGVVVRRGADFAAAEDALQEALVKAVRTWHDPPRDPKGWLVTVACRQSMQPSARSLNNVHSATESLRNHRPRTPWGIVHASDP